MRRLLPLLLILVVAAPATAADIPWNPARPTLAAATASWQFGPEIAASPEPGADADLNAEIGRVVAFVQGQHPRLSVSFDGTTQPGAEWPSADAALNVPVIARSTAIYLVVWGDLAIRFGLDGHRIDEQPFRIGSDLNGETVAAWNGTEFLAVYPSEYSFFGLRLDAFGNPSGEPFPILPAALNERFELPSISPISDGFAVTVSGRLTTALQPHEAPPPPTRIWSAIVDNGGSIRVPMHLLIDGATVPDGVVTKGVASARRDDRVTIAWLDFSQTESGLASTPALSLMEISPSGELAAAPRVVWRGDPGNFELSSLLPLPLAIEWNGAEHVVAWFDFSSRKSFVMRFDRDLMPLDNSPATLLPSQMYGYSERLRISRSDGGVVIAYARPDADGGGQTRVFTRSLARSGSPTRRRAIRH